MNNFAQDVIQAYERSLVKIILYCIAELPFQFGMKRIVQVLRGSKSSFVIDHEIYKLDMYGILPNFRSAYLDRVIEKMREQGLLTIEMVVSRYGNLPTIKITDKGEDYLVSKYEAHINFAQELSDREVILLDDKEKILFEELKQIRRDLSVEEEIPAYMVCSTISLREIAKSKPKTGSELLNVHGIGEKFMQKYGNGFICAIKLFLSEEAVA